MPVAVAVAVAPFVADMLHTQGLEQQLPMPAIGLELLHYTVAS